MALLTGGVSATENLPPLEGNVSQNVDKNTASAGGNVFNQVYAPAIDTTGLQRIPTVLPAATISNLSPSPIAPAQFTPQNVSIPASSSAYQRVPSVPLNLPSGPNVIGGIQYSPNQLVAYNPTPQGPSFRPQQAQSDGGGGSAPQVAPPFERQPQQQQIPNFPRPVTTPPQLMPMQAQRGQMPYVDPALIGQAQQSYQQNRAPVTPEELRARRDMDIANAYARGMMAQHTAPVPHYTPMARFMQGLTRNNLAQAVAHQKATNDYNKQVFANQRAGLAAYGANSRAAYQAARQDRRAEDRFTGQAINRIRSEAPSRDAVTREADRMLKQWPDPADPEQMSARLRHIEAIYQSTGGPYGGIDLSAWTHIPGNAYLSIQEGRELRNEGNRIKNDIAQQTKQDVIDKKHADALAAMDRSIFLQKTRDDRIRYEKLKADNAARRLELSKQFGEEMAQSLLASRYSGLVRDEIGALESAAKGDKSVLDQWNRVQARKAQAVALDDGNLLKQAEDEEKTFGEMKGGVPVSVRTAIKNLNGLAAGIGDVAAQNISPDLRKGIQNTLMDTAAGLKQRKGITTKEYNGQTRN